MMTIHTEIAWIILFLALPPIIHAKHPHGQQNQNTSYYDYAKVIHVEPIIKRHRVRPPQHECGFERMDHDEYRPHTDNSTGNIIVGGVLGGVLGAQMSRKRYSHIPSIAGAVIGASLGHQISNRQQVKHRKHCRPSQRVQMEEHIKGYLLTYRYRGEHYTTRTRYEPGRRIKVRVEVTPMID